jgi:hypothetical protein
MRERKIGNLSGTGAMAKRRVVCQLRYARPQTQPGHSHEQCRDPLPWGNRSRPRTDGLRRWCEYIHEHSEYQSAECADTNSIRRPGKRRGQCDRAARRRDLYRRKLRRTGGQSPEPSRASTPSRRSGSRRLQKRRAAKCAQVCPMATGASTSEARSSSSAATPARR